MQGPAVSRRRIFMKPGLSSLLHKAGRAAIQSSPKNWGTMMSFGETCKLYALLWVTALAYKAKQAGNTENIRAIHFGVYAAITDKFLGIKMPVKGG